VTSMIQIFQNTGLSVNHYDALITQWQAELAEATTPTTLAGVSFHGGSSVFCTATDPGVTDGNQDCGPRIIRVQMPSSGASLTVTFNEAVFANSDGSGALVPADFTVSISGSGASLNSATPLAIYQSGNVFILGLDISGTLGSSQVITVNAADGDSIYDSGGTALVTTTQIHNDMDLSDTYNLISGSSPVMTDAGATLAYTDGDGASVIDSALTITDSDDTHIEGAAVVISGGFVSSEDVLAFSNTGTITGSWDGTNGILTLSGSDTLANYELALESVTYNNSSGTPNTSNRTISWLVRDGEGMSAGISSTITVTDINSAPVIATNTGGIVAEGGTLTITNAMLDEGDPDDSGAGLTYSVTTASSNGRLELSSAAGVSITSFTQADVNSGLVQVCA